MEGKNKYKNCLRLYRRRMGFSQRQVAQLLGKAVTMISRYETGSCLPPMLVALRLEIIYRVPLAFLYGNVYDANREQIRKKEAAVLPRHPKKS